MLLAFLLIRPVVALTHRHHRTARPPTSRAARTADALTTGAAACAVPAAIGLALAARRRVGRGRVVVRLLLLLALVGIAWVAATFNLVGSSVSY